MRNTLKSILLGLTFLAIPSVSMAQVQNDKLEQALQVWSENGDSNAVQASVDFNALIDVTEAVKISKEYNLQPYVVFMSLGDQNGIHRVLPYIADSSVIFDALEETKNQKETVMSSLKDRAKLTHNAIREINKSTNNGKGKGKNQSTSNDKDEKLAVLRRQARAIIDRKHSEVKAKNVLKDNPKFIYGLEFVASTEKILELANAYDVQVGVFINERIVVLNPTQDIVPSDVSFENLSVSELETQLNSIAQGE